MNSAQRTAADAQRWRFVWPFGNNAGAHLTKRRDHAVHRTSRQSRFPNEPAFKCLAGQQTGEQPHRGTRIATVDFFFGCIKDPFFSVNDQRGRLRLFDFYA